MVFPTVIHFCKYSVLNKYSPREFIATLAEMSRVFPMFRLDLSNDTTIDLMLKIWKGSESFRIVTIIEL